MIVVRDDFDVDVEESSRVGLSILFFLFSGLNVVQVPPLNFDWKKVYCGPTRNYFDYFLLSTTTTLLSLTSLKWLLGGAK
jgi:hypothetical protein